MRGWMRMTKEQKMSDRKLTFTVFYSYDATVSFINMSHIKSEDIQQIIINENQVVVFWWN